MSFERHLLCTIALCIQYLGVDFQTLLATFYCEARIDVPTRANTNNPHATMHCMTVEY